MATMDAAQYMEQLKSWERQVAAWVAGHPLASAAFASLMQAVSEQIADRDAEIQRLSGVLATEEAERIRCRDGWQHAQSDLHKCDKAYCDEHQRVLDLQNEVSGLKTELEIAKDELKDLRENRRGIIGQAHSDRADLYEAQDRLEQMGESERY